MGGIEASQGGLGGVVVDIGPIPFGELALFKGRWRKLGEGLVAQFLSAMEDRGGGRRPMWCSIFERDEGSWRKQKASVMLNF